MIQFVTELNFVDKFIQLSKKIRNIHCHFDKLGDHEVILGFKPSQYKKKIQNSLGFPLGFKTYYYKSIRGWQ